MLQSVTDMKGAVVSAYQSGNSVKVWVSSPTGDSSDSFTYDIPCLSEEQAMVIAEMWRKAWNLI